MATTNEQQASPSTTVSIRGGEVERGPFSIPALLAFLCALASILGLFNMLLWFFAPTALALSFLALLLIRRRSDTVRGRRLALIAMALSSAVGTWGLVRPNVQRQFLCNRADAVAREWLEIVQSGDQPRAYAMLGDSRQTASFSPPQAQAQMHSFFEQEPFYTIMRSKGTFTPRGIVEYVEWPLHVDITLRYDFHPESERADLKIPVVLRITRQFHFQKGYFFWYIAEVRSTPKST